MFGGALGSDFAAVVDLDDEALPDDEVVADDEVASEDEFAPEDEAASDDAAVPEGSVVDEDPGVFVHPPMASNIPSVATQAIWYRRIFSSGQKMGLGKAKRLGRAILKLAAALLNPVRRYRALHIRSSQRSQKFRMGSFGEPSGLNASVSIRRVYFCPTSETGILLSARNFSASIAAMQPDPAAVIAWR